MVVTLGARGFFCGEVATTRQKLFTFNIYSVYRRYLFFVRHNLDRGFIAHNRSTKTKKNLLTVGVTLMQDSEVFEFCEHKDYKLDLKLLVTY